MPKLPPPVSFEWDQGNKDKNWEKHQIHFKEIEEVFANKPLLTFPDIKHSSSEQRFLALGKTNTHKPLTVIFTIREQKVRVISARKQNQKERQKYASQKN